MERLTPRCRASARLDGSFSPEKTYCNNRLAVGYLPDAPRPERWLRFLSELLEPEDFLKP